MQNNKEYFVICLEGMLVSVFCPADHRFPGGRQDLYQCPKAASHCRLLPDANVESIAAVERIAVNLVDETK